MNKIILIEDRPERMNIFLDSIKDKSFGRYSFFYIVTGSEFDKVKNIISNPDQTEQYFREYSVIICHRSAFGEDVRINLQNHCREKKKPLVLFSGSISQSFFQVLQNPLLSLNSKTLYSNNLFLFLDECSKGNIELMILQYGDNWQINLLLTIRDKMNRLILYKDRSSRTYFNLESELRQAFASDFKRIGISLDDTDWSIPGIELMKMAITKRINEKFAFQL